MSIKHRLAAGAVFLSLSVVSTAALAEDHGYAEGAVSQVSSIRTLGGHFDDYMTWLDTVWKKRQEAAKKAGYIVDYAVFMAQPRTENDADIYLVITYKNHAALDNWISQGDALAMATEGSVAAASKSASDRDKIRRVLGSETLQALNLK